MTPGKRVENQAQIVLNLLLNGMLQPQKWKGNDASGYGVSVKLFKGSLEGKYEMGERFILNTKQFTTNVQQTLLADTCLLFCKNFQYQIRKLGRCVKLKSS